MDSPDNHLRICKVAGPNIPIQHQRKFCNVPQIRNISRSKFEGLCLYNEGIAAGTDVCDGSFTLVATHCYIEVTYSFGK
ncbi:hypothetical protein GH714_000894 [Hevea brasiliensis]|uniref:Uncharacterized protein n=1 Tax=Hevea brasiliensis TaxID=3981 RepID=A0A6A6L984_HEVBR|nr:hypothetical protein GH714_000894 [Hevea brasiliensis]